MLELSPEQRAQWSQMFADYELAQPVRQLARETYVLDADEQGASSLSRFTGRRVASVGLLALAHRDWTRQSENGGEFTLCTLELPEGLRAELSFSPGMPIGEATSVPVQTLSGLHLTARDAQGRDTPQSWVRLDPLLASETLRDVELLVPARGEA